MFLNKASIKGKFQLELTYRFSPQQLLQAETLEKHGSMYKNATVEGATQAAGYKQKQYKPWMMDETCENIQGSKAHNHQVRTRRRSSFKRSQRVVKKSQQEGKV